MLFHSRPTVRCFVSKIRTCAQHSAKSVSVPVITVNCIGIRPVLVSCRRSRGTSKTSFGDEPPHLQEQATPLLPFRCAYPQPPSWRPSPLLWTPASSRARVLHAVSSPCSSAPWSLLLAPSLTFNASLLHGAGHPVSLPAVPEPDGQSVVKDLRMSLWQNVDLITAKNHQTYWEGSSGHDNVQYLFVSTRNLVSPRKL